MSFGYSVGDLITTSQLCWAVYRACRGAAGEYEEMSAELKYISTLNTYCRHE